MIINLLCKAFIAILDILLLDFYLKNICSKIYLQKIGKLIFFVHVCFFTSMIFITDIISYICVYIFVFLTLCFLLLFFHADIIEFFKQFFIFLSLLIIIKTIIIFIFSWLFNTHIYVFYSSNSFGYTFLSHLISNYIILFILIILNKHSLAFPYKYFKITSTIMLICFSITFMMKTPILFRTVSIARTYIFTVVISIVALICFDRMQTKYETDKHTKEAIIQNMAKEEEFVQELEKQQLEIRKINHNLNHILIILQSHLKQGEYKEALEYIDKNLDIHIKAYQALTHTGMTMIDSTINHQIYQMKEQNIEYDEDITKILHLGSIVPDDLSLVLGLAFDNAREACEKVKDQRKISLKLQSKQTHIIIHITNSIPRGSHPYFHKTSKKDSVAHGYGVKGIKEIAKKYHGDVKYDVKDDCVILRIMLQK